MVVFNLSARVITLNMQSDFAQVGLLGQALKAVRSSFDARICIFGHIGWGYREQNKPSVDDHSTYVRSWTI